MIEFNIIAEVIQAIHAAVNDGISSATQDLATTAAANAPDATGFLRSTVYVQTKAGSTYGQGTLAPTGDATLLEELPAPGDLEANIGVAASYGVYVELGTRYMPAQPFLAPAAAQAPNQFDSTFSDFEGMIAKRL